MASWEDMPFEPDDPDASLREESIRDYNKAVVHALRLGLGNDPEINDLVAKWVRAQRALGNRDLLRDINRSDSVNWPEDPLIKIPASAKGVKRPFSHDDQRLYEKILALAQQGKSQSTAQRTLTARGHIKKMSQQAFQKLLKRHGLLGAFRSRRTK